MNCSFTNRPEQKTTFLYVKTSFCTTRSVQCFPVLHSASVAEGECHRLPSLGVRRSIRRFEEPLWTRCQLDLNGSIRITGFDTAFETLHAFRHRRMAATTGAARIAWPIHTSAHQYSLSLPGVFSLVMCWQKLLRTCACNR